MLIEMVKESGKNTWERYVQDNPYSIAWQSYEWSTLLKKHYPVEFYPVAAYEGEKIRGILPLYRVKTSPRNSVLMSVPYAVAGGIVADNEEAASALLAFAIDMADRISSCTVTLKQYKVKMNGNLSTDDRYYNRELDLTPGLPAVWDGLAEANKQHIEDSKKHELRLEHPSDDVTRFYKLLLSHSHKKGVPCVSRKWIEDLIAFKMYSIALLWRGNELVAGAMVKEFKDTVSFPFTCMPETSAKNGMFVYRLYWELISSSASRGKRIVHSGRVPVTDETDDYRLGWGGAKYNYFYQYYPGTTGITEFSRKRGWKRGLFEKLWRIVPQPVAGALGPSIVKKFP